MTMVLEEKGLHLPLKLTVPFARKPSVANVASLVVFHQVSQVQLMKLNLQRNETKTGV